MSLNSASLVVSGAMNGSSNSALANASSYVVVNSIVGCDHLPGKAAVVAMATKIRALERSSTAKLNAKF